MADRHVILDEVEGGILTRYEILEHPHEHGQAVEAVNHHQQVFAHAPGLVAGDRGVHSAETEGCLQAAGVKRVSIPAEGKSQKNAKPWSRHADGSEGIAGVRVLRAGSPV